MKTKTFEVELLSDLVLTKNSASEGQQPTLDVISGAVFLGWIAGQMYADLEKKNAEDSFCVFHSGRFRFGDALPVFGKGGRTFPMPLSIHREKIDETERRDLSHSSNRKEPDQPRQVRNGFVNTDNETCANIPKRSHAKVALKKRHLSRRSVLKDAKENQLFVYESLAAGSCFRFELQADDDVKQELFDKVVQKLSNASARLGRSRKSEFGQVRISEVDEVQLLSKGLGASDQGEVKLLLISDLALRDAFSGQPTCHPDVSFFPLPKGAKLDWGRSFLRKERYSPFNGKRKRPDLERQVLCKGSVLVFTECGDVDHKKLQKDLSAGIGEYREQGLGVIAVNPSCLQEEIPMWNLCQVKQRQYEVKELKDPTDSLFTFVKGRGSQRKQREDAFKTSRDWAKVLKPFAEKSKGPGRAQWGMLRQVAAQEKDFEGLYKKLLGEKKDGLLYSGVRAHAWDEHGAVDELKRLVGVLKEEGKQELFPIILQQTASRVLRLLGQGEDK